MTETVTFLMNCADDRVGETKEIDARRARRLAMTGYVQLVERATVPEPERAEQVRPVARGPKTERRA